MKNIQKLSSMEQTVVKSFMIATVQLARDSKKLNAAGDPRKLFIKFPTDSGHYVIEYDIDAGLRTGNSWLKHEFVVGVDEPISTESFDLPVSEISQFVLQFPIEVTQKSLADFEQLRTELINS